MLREDAIYLDYAAAAPLDEGVAAAMRPYAAEQFYNPSAAYSAARAARQAHETARADIAGQLGAKPHDIILTAGATESINLAIQGVLRAHPGSRAAVCAIEHQAVLAAAAAFQHTIVTVDTYGRVSREALEQAVDDNTSVISIGLVNGEIGTRQPVKDLARHIKVIREDRRARGVELPLYFHTDASQAAGTEDLQVARLGVDMLTLGANKIYGPKQTGLLYVRRGVALEPLIYGGGQERGLRSGTEDVAGAVGCAEALRRAVENRRERAERLRQLKTAFIGILRSALPEAAVTVPPEQSAPHILHFALPGTDAERLLYLLDGHGVMVATGAACAANKQTASHVLRSIGMDEASIQGSIRCSFGHALQYGAVQRAAREVAACARKLASES